MERQEEGDHIKRKGKREPGLWGSQSVDFLQASISSGSLQCFSVCIVEPERGESLRCGQFGHNVRGRKCVPLK